MTTLAALAEFIQSRELAEPPPERQDRVKLHVVDTLGALLVGRQLAEGRSAEACAAIRCTEMDDIHLASCTTPSSVVVPAAFSLAAELRGWREFSAAVTAGYEMLIRLGYAIDGPNILKKKIWPTYFAATVGSAAVASRAFGLGVGETAGALSTALALSTGTSAPARDAASSRWLTLGIAADNGIRAARAAREGFGGCDDLLEKHSGRIAGVAISRRRLLHRLGHDYLFDEIGVKPYPIARQALAAVEACSTLVSVEKLKLAAIEEIVVWVPEQQRWVIDHPETPATRIESVVSAQYQIALALLAPERLAETHRTPPFRSAPLRNVMAKVRVRRGAALEKYYPAAWPSQVEIKAAGRRFRHQILYPRGDARNPLGWDYITLKFPALTTVIKKVRSLNAEDVVPNIWEVSH